MLEHDEDIDSLFQSAFQEYEKEPAEQSWDAIRKKLFMKKYNFRTFPLFLLAVSAILSAGMFSYLTLSDMLKPEIQEIAYHEVVSTDQEIDVADKPVKMEREHVFFSGALLDESDAEEGMKLISEVWPDNHEKYTVSVTIEKQSGQAFRESLSTTKTNFEKSKTGNAQVAVRSGATVKRNSSRTQANSAKDQNPLPGKKIKADKTSKLDRLINRAKSKEQKNLNDARLYGTLHQEDKKSKERFNRQIAEVRNRLNDPEVHKKDSTLIATSSEDQNQDDSYELANAKNEPFVRQDGLAEDNPTEPIENKNNAVVEPSAEGNKDEKKKPSAKFSVDIYAGPSLAQKSLKDIGNKNSELLANRRDNEKPTVSLHAGAEVKYRLGNVIAGTGLNYVVQGEKNNYDFTAITGIGSTQIFLGMDSVPVYDNNGNKTGMKWDSIFKTRYDTSYSRLKSNTANRYQYIEIPLIIGYRFNLKRFDIEVANGIGLGLLMSSKGNLLGVEADNTAVYTMKDELPARKSMISYIFRLGCAYRWNDKLSLIVNTSYRQNLSSVFKEGAYPLDQRYRMLSLNTGMRFNF